MGKENYQIMYNLKGLRAPIEGKIYFDKFFFSRKPGTELVYDSATRLPRTSIDLKGYAVFDDDGYAAIKIDDMAGSESSDSATIELEKILHFYALISGIHVQSPQATRSCQINEQHPFGEYYGGGLTMGPVLTQEQREYEKINLDKTMDLYSIYKKVYDQKTLQYLKNSIIYYYRATDDLNSFRLEEGLIDLIIALEYLLSNESSEIRFKISSRAATILTLETGDYETKFKEVYESYKKRNNIIHGLKEVTVIYQEVETLKNNIRQLILSFLKMNKSKKVILGILEGCLTQKKGCIDELRKMYQGD